MSWTSYLQDGDPARKRPEPEHDGLPSPEGSITIGLFFSLFHRLCRKQLTAQPSCPRASVRRRHRQGSGHYRYRVRRKQNSPRRQEKGLFCTENQPLTRENPAPRVISGNDTTGRLAALVPRLGFRRQAVTARWLRRLGHDSREYYSARNPHGLMASMLNRRRPRSLVQSLAKASPLLNTYR